MYNPLPLLTALYITAPELPATTRDLTEETMVALALEQVPELNESQASIESAQAVVATSRFGLIPKFSVQASYARIGGFDDGAIEVGPNVPSVAIAIPRDRYSATAQLSYPLVASLLGQLSTLGGNKARVAAEKLEKARTEATIRLEAKSRYHRYLGAMAAAAVAEQSLELANAQRTRVKARLDAGSATRADLASATARVSSRKAEYGRAAGEVDIRLMRIQTYIRAPNLKKGAIPEGWYTLQPVEIQATEALHQAFAHRPELKGVDALKKAEKYQKRALLANMLPELNLSAEALQANPNINIVPPSDKFQGSWQVGAAISWSLDATLQAHGQRRQSQARAHSLSAQRERFERVIEEEVRTAWVELRTSELEYSAASDGRVAAATAYEARQASYEVGRTTLDELLAADVDLAQAKLSVIQALMKHHLRRAELARAMALQ